MLFFSTPGSFTFIVMPCFMLPVNRTINKTITEFIVIRLSQDQMQYFVSPEVIFQGCLSDFILCFLKSTDETVL